MTIYLDLIFNMAMLVALSIVSGFIERRWARHTRSGVLLQGVLFGAAAVVGMLHPLNLGPGLIFDGRSIMVSLCALFFGPWAAAVSCGMAIICRIGLGGAGTVMGVLVVLSSTGIGLLGHFRFKPDSHPPSTGRLYFFGIIVHIAMLALTLTLPEDVWLGVLRRIGLPVILIYPLATILAGKILSDQVAILRTLADLQQTKQQLAITLKSIGDALISANRKGEIVFMNPVAESLTGWAGPEAYGKPLETVFRIVNEETGNTVENPVAKVLREGSVVDMANHTLLIARDGGRRPIADSAAPIRDEKNEITGVVLVFRDQTEERLALRMTGIRLALIEYAATHTLAELMTRALDEIDELVDGPIGFLHFVETDQKTLSLQQWSTRTLKEFCRAVGHGLHYPLEQAGVWADCARRKKPVIHNDYATLQDKQGMPEGHAKVIRELVVPVIRENQVVAIVGVGNKPVDYTDKDVEMVSYLADVVWEIVERKRSEEALRASEEKHRRLFETLTQGVVYQGANDEIISANPAAQRILGLSLDQLRGKTSMDPRWRAIREDGTELPGQEHPSMVALRTGKPVERFVMGVMKPQENAHTWISVTAIPLFQPGDTKPFQVYATFDDITAQRRAERNYQMLFREMLSGFALHEIICDEKGDPENYRFLAVNPAFERITGLKATDIVGRTVLEVMPGTERHWIDTYGKVALTGEPVFFENYAADIEKYFEVTAFQPAPNQFACMFTDITERKQIEMEKDRLQAQFVQAQKMESVGRLAGGVAHDYNNMLSVILGYTELGLEKVAPSEPLHADLKEILAAARRSADITRQLLAFARKQTIAPKVLDINETVENMLTMLRRLIGEDIDLAWLPESNVQHIKIDPSQLEQILANLCVNARDAIAGVGKITIETHTVIFDDAYCAEHIGFVPGEFVLLAVSDDGCGMDKETLGSIFEPFFTTKDVNQGTGLGLATVYGIVKQNTGFINVYSEPGKGTTLRIYLPCHVGEKEKIPAQVITEILAGRGERVLLVEDESLIREMGQRMLERLGYQVMAAATPGDALRLAGEHQDGIALLITDVVMPKMNGRDLANQLHNLYPNIKILFMSGYTANVIAHHGVLDEGVQFIQKPFSMKDLGAKVRAILDQT
ncbi:MAG: PAS domain S-box protein [Pseudomonadota bacterium]